MTVNLIRSDSLYAGVPYAYASIAAPGALVFTAGACPLDDNRELGLIVSDHAALSAMARTFAADFRNGKHWP